MSSVAATSIAAVVQQPAQSDAAGASTSGAAPRIAEHLVLHLVPARRRKKKGVQWAEDVVDNEGLGKKSSKKCCIFHKQRAFGEWSDGEDSDAECEQCQEQPS